MIYSLNGKLLSKTPGLAVVECGGVGYACLISLKTLQSLPEPGQPCLIYTHMSVRDDAVELCGFSSQDELSCFRLLLGVSGVGLRVALAILSDLSPDRFAVCVASGDEKTLRKCSGVGTKLAQRIILELKDKLAKGNAVLTATAEAASAETGGLAEAVTALEVLGYPRADAVSALTAFDPTLPVEELIKRGLRKLSERK